MKHLNAVLLLCAVFAGYASADVKTYTSRTAWAAAVSGPTTINFGTAAPVAAGQIDLLIPYELATTGTVTVQVKTPSGTSLNYALTMAPSVPGLYFLADPSTTGRLNAPAQLNATAWLIMPDAMAAALKIPGNCSASNYPAASLGASLQLTAIIWCSTSPASEKLPRMAIRMASSSRPATIHLPTAACSIRLS